MISITDMNDSRPNSKTTMHSIKPYIGGDFRVRRDQLRPGTTLDSPMAIHSFLPGDKNKPDGKILQPIEEGRKQRKFRDSKETDYGDGSMESELKSEMGRFNKLVKVL